MDTIYCSKDDPPCEANEGYGCTGHEVAPNDGLLDAYQYLYTNAATPLQQEIAEKIRWSGEAGDVPHLQVPYSDQGPSRAGDLVEAARHEPGTCARCDGDR